MENGKRKNVREQKAGDDRMEIICEGYEGDITKALRVKGNLSQVLGPRCDKRDIQRIQGIQGNSKKEYLRK